MKRRKNAVMKKFAEEMQIPESAVTDSFTVEFRGGNDVSVEGCRGIVEYEDSVIALNLGAVIVRFRGADLEITNFFEQQVLIKGTIASMEFST